MADSCCFTLPTPAAGSAAVGTGEPAACSYCDDHPLPLILPTMHHTIMVLAGTVAGTCCYPCLSCP